MMIIKKGLVEIYNMMITIKKIFYTMLVVLTLPFLALFLITLSTKGILDGYWQAMFDIWDKE